MPVTTRCNTTMQPLAECTLCPRRCRAQRSTDAAGRCGCTGSLKVAWAGLHHWEEPPLSAFGGAGAVFFAGCPLRCVYCQNHRICRGGGRTWTVVELADQFLALQAQGAQNLDLVTGTPYVPQIIEAVRRARDCGLQLPVVWNTSGYESVETLAALQGTVDIYLTDFKYWQDETGQRYSGARDYRRQAKLALAEMIRQQPRCLTTADGAMRSGVIVRHLVLPGCYGEAARILRYLGSTWSGSVWVSLMRQYTPTEHLAGYPELQRTVSAERYAALAALAERYAFGRLFLQEEGCAESGYVPDFSV